MCLWFLFWTCFPRGGSLTKFNHTVLSCSWVTNTVIIWFASFKFTAVRLKVPFVLPCVCCRENEVLKVQLKKYVGAVQMLKREGSQGNDGNAHAGGRQAGTLPPSLARSLARHYNPILDSISVSQSISYALKQKNEVIIRFLYVPDQLWCLPPELKWPTSRVCGVRLSEPLAHLLFPSLTLLVS